MAYYVPPGGFLSHPQVAMLPGRRVKLLEGLSYWSNYSPYRFHVVAGTVSDLASIPRIFWKLWPPWGDYNDAAILHDYLYKAQITTRKVADQIFLEAMLSPPAMVSPATANSLYVGVRLGGGRPWNQYRKELL